MAETVRTPFSRVFTIEDKAGPANAPVYQGQGRAMGPSWGFGDLTPIREPDPDRYGAFKVVGSIRGERDLPTLPLEVRYTYTLSEMLRIGRKGCPLDAQIHMGKCQDPRDFDGGWDKVLVFEGAYITNWAPGELGALEQGEDAVINESVDLTGEDMYEVKKLNLSELAAAAITREVIDVAICDSVQCGICGVPSDGCQVAFAITLQSIASPGLPAELFYTSDGGAIWASTNITTITAGNAPTALGCVGTRLAVLSNAENAIGYALISEILLGTETWVEVTGYAGPNAIFSLGSTFTWIVADAGYIYFTSDITAAPTTQSAGAATVQNLTAIHGIDENNLVAVGASNAVVYTRDGGLNWSAVVGPAVGVALTGVWMRGENEWVVCTTGGRLYYTLDAGATWTEKAFPGSGTGTCRDVVFGTPSVGYLAHATATPAGRVLRTINGGFSWYVLPEGTGTIPANDRINAIAACAENPNVFFAGGLADNATDGYLVKGA